ncbi:transmembrane protein 120 homolog isoform X1 [Anopheles stephensi]|uniref:transmembrane protein 120 homolog isoform X1 n=1 Tax=Anopheles stephensi TaxID=30069 RepID=UPI001658B983|nr:transmembrane protein 120 homolog isoform X1 [Anopheles stephensi]
MSQSVDVDELEKDWSELSDEFRSLEAANQSYQELHERLEEMQEKCTKQIQHQRYRMRQISKNLKTFMTKQRLTHTNKEKMTQLEKSIMKRKAQIHEIEQGLPQQNSRYLKIILGDVNVSILNRNDKIRYKDEYEKFKLILNVIGLLLSFLNIVYNYRALELVFLFLLVWYYCTLTIRESILKVNGSRIKGWWRLHHFISTVCAGVLLVWPQGEPWQLFRTQFMYFNVYISMVQYMQFRYQKGVLYRLKALGERHNMDITIEGFHSWMWRGLKFLFPFLFVGYLFQFYNAFTLYHLTNHPDATWQVCTPHYTLHPPPFLTDLSRLPQIPVLSILFLILFVGNSLTTLMVILQKQTERTENRYRLMSLIASKRQKNVRQPTNDDEVDGGKGDADSAKSK